MSELKYSKYYESNDDAQDCTLKRTLSLLTSYSRNSMYAFHTLSKDMLRKRESIYDRKDLDITSLEVKYVDGAPNKYSNLVKDTTESLSKVTITSTKLCDTSNQSIDLGIKGKFIPTTRPPTPPSIRSKVLDEVEKRLRKLSQENEKAKVFREKSSVSRSATTVMKGLRRLSSSASFSRRRTQTAKANQALKKAHSSNDLQYPEISVHKEQPLQNKPKVSALLTSTVNGNCVEKMPLNDANKSSLQFLIPNRENPSSASPHLDTNTLISNIVTLSGDEDVTGALIYLLNNDSRLPF